MFAEAREKSSDQKLAAAYRQMNWIFSLSLPVSLDVAQCERLGGSHCVK